MLHGCVKLALKGAQTEVCATGAPPRFFVSVDSKEISVFVSPSDATLEGLQVGADSKAVIGN
jgi:hypothetical protein